VGGVKVVELAGTGDSWSFRRLPQALADLGLTPKHVLHVGANLGQEVPDYRRAGIEQVTLVEPDPDVAATLRETYPDLPVLEVACATQPGTALLSRATDASVWSTLATTPLPHGKAITSRVEVKVVTVAEIQGDADMLVVDTQGTELDALMSADLSRLSVVVIETQNIDPNQHAGYFPHVRDYMAGHGWVPALQWLHEAPRQYFASFADTFFVAGP
jgi:FkbM family methyltransferase